MSASPFGCFRAKDCSHHYCCLIWSHSLCLPLRTNYCGPDFPKWWRRIIEENGEEGTIPSVHAIWLFISVDQIVEKILGVAPFCIIALKQSCIDLLTLLDWRPYMDLQARQPKSTLQESRGGNNLTTQCGVSTALASQYN